jgi:hypothetical protein
VASGEQRRNHLKAGDFGLGDRLTDGQARPTVGLAEEKEVRNWLGYAWKRKGPTTGLLRERKGDSA